MNDNHIADDGTGVIYQTRAIDSVTWIDQSKDGYDHMTKYPMCFDVRVLYAAPIAPRADDFDAQIGRALIANGIYDRMNDLVDDVNELIAAVNPILDAKFAHRRTAPRADADTEGEKLDEAKGILRLFYEACSACDPETGPYLDTDKLHEAYEALCAKGIQYLRGSNGNWPIATPASSVADAAGASIHERFGNWLKGPHARVQTMLDAYAAGASERAKYDPATQPGSPEFDGAEAYQAHLEAMYPDAPDERADADIRRAALEEAYDAAMSCDGALNNAGAVAVKIRALVAATPASSVADAAGEFNAEQENEQYETFCKTEGVEICQEGWRAWQARALIAAGASDRADAEKDAALTDEQQKALKFAISFIDTRGYKKEAALLSAILAANGEKK